jgi:MinD superfamily P-loop ATPase
MRPHVEKESCSMCGLCVKVCRSDVFAEDEEIIVLSPEACTECGACAEECPMEAIDLYD